MKYIHYPEMDRQNFKWVWLLYVHGPSARWMKSFLILLDVKFPVLIQITAQVDGPQFHPVISELVGKEYA